MSENRNKPHWIFWVLAGIFLFWNGMSIFNFFWQMNPESINEMSEAQKAIIFGRPVWATAAFGLSVFTGTLASVFLVLRKSLALPTFIVAYIATIIQIVPQIPLVSSNDSVNPEILSYIVMTLIAGFVFIVFSKLAKAKNWLT